MVFMVVGRKTPSQKKKEMVECVVLGGSRCSICGGQIADGDTICVHGHELGRKYEKLK